MYKYVNKGRYISMEERGMRDFKFRAWDKEESIMHNWNSFGSDGYGFFSDSSPVTRWGDEFPSEEDGIMLMQYTGLKDDNGKDIYEGDIVSGTLYEDTEFKNVVVIFEEGCFSIEGIDDESYTTALYHVSEIKIIGNIYEG